MDNGQKPLRALKLGVRIWTKIKIVNEDVTDLINKSELTVFELTYNKVNCTHYVVASILAAVRTTREPKIKDEKMDH